MTIRQDPEMHWRERHPSEHKHDFYHNFRFHCSPKIYNGKANPSVNACGGLRSVSPLGRITTGRDGEGKGGLSAGAGKTMSRLSEPLRGSFGSLLDAGAKLISH